MKVKNIMTNFSRIRIFQPGEYKYSQSTTSISD
jgi:hypothetical protein